jgi:arsenite methyltransferase
MAAAKPGSKSQAKAEPPPQPFSRTPGGNFPDYGIDSPSHIRRMFIRAACSLAGGVLVWYMNREEYPGPAFSLLLVFAVLAAAFFAAGAHMRWSSKVGKLALRDRLLDELPLQGDEKVLDAGCGRGLMAIGAAKRLKAGKVTAVDIWDPHAISGNSGDAARENAKIEGVAERVRIENGDMRKLTYPTGSFDVVISTYAVHHMPDEPDRDQSVRELYRVLKPGGRLLICDTLHTGRYSVILKQLGAANVTVKAEGFLWCRPMKSVWATKG